MKTSRACGNVKAIILICRGITAFAAICFFLCMPAYVLSVHEGGMLKRLFVFLVNKLGEQAFLLIVPTIMTIFGFVVVRVSLGAGVGSVESGKNQRGQTEEKKRR